MPFVRAYVVADGLPHNTVHSLLLDHRGLLWVGTQDGVARYDGRAWTELELPSREVSNFARALFQSSDGALWVATQGAGLLRYRDGAWKRFGPGAGGFPDLRANAVAETAGPDGPWIWVAGHSHGLSRFDGESWRTWTTADGLPADRIWDLLPVATPEGGRLWVATERGPAYLELPGGRVVVPAGTPEDSASSLAEVPGAEGSGPAIWAGLYGGGLLRFADGAWRRFGAAEGLPSPFVTDLATRPGAPGQLWVATDGGGLALWDGAGLRPVALGASFSSRAVYRVLETTAAQGAAAVWIGTRNNGLLRLTAGYWRSFVPFPEIPRSTVSSLLVRDDAPSGPEVWLGTDGYGLAIWRAGEWHRVSRAGGEIGHDSVLALAETRATGTGRKVWVGTRNGGLSMWDGAHWHRFDAADGELDSDLVQTLLETVDARGRGALWVGTREGLSRFDGGRWERLDPARGWPASSILALLDDGGAIWIGTSSGLYRWRQGSVRHWGPEEGLPSPTVHALHLRARADGRRELWLGTDGGGAAILDPDDDSARIRPLSDLGYPHLPDGVVYGVVEDASGRLYLPTNRGVARLTPGGAQGAAAWLERLTVDEGLPASQASRGALAVDDRGRIWVGTVGGAAALDPANEPEDRAPKRIVLGATIADGSGRTLAPGTRLPHDRDRVIFRYALLSYFAESQTRYCTQLAGREAAATEWTSLAEREFASLPAGAYVFRVWGRDAGGRVSGPEELAFTVAPAPWQTLWARLGAAALGVLAMVGLLRARARVHRRREGELEDLVAVRTSRLQRANALLIELSYLDALTAIPNRRRFDELLETEWKRSLRTGSPLAVAMIDIDRFKAYNDGFGHQRGDDCLRRVAAELADGLPRSGDSICRYGGEEFAVVLPATDLEGARQVAEQLRRRVEVLGDRNPGSDVAPVVTVSCGVAAAVPDVHGGDPRSLVTAADRALYEAKNSGRNRVVAGG